jgi:pimeloyl-ACP methyl ester carboxylesterase
MPTFTTSTIQLKDVTLSYTEWPGEKGPVICLPSFAGHKGSFIKIAESLAPAYHLFALDLRGRGDSDKPVEGYGFAYHSRDIFQFVDALGIDTFAIIGHSFGATVGTYLASIRPLRVRAIVMIEGGADPTERVLEAIRPALRHLDKHYPSMEAYLEAMRELPFYNNPWSPSLEEYLRQDVEVLSNGVVHPKASAEGLQRDLNLHFHYSMCLHFPFMQCPALFIRAGEGLLGGDQGHIFTEPETNAIVEWIPKGRRVDLPGANHYTLVLHDDPPVIPPIRTFLDEVLSKEMPPATGPPSTTFEKMSKAFSEPALKKTTD